MSSQKASIRREVEALPVSMSRLRGLLAEHGISRKRFAEACGLTPAYVSTLVFQRLVPGELALIKLRAGLESLGLLADIEPSPPHASRARDRKAVTT